MCWGLMLTVLATACSVAAEPIHVMFTVDVESTSKGNPDKDIWGRMPNEPEEYGIGRMMDIFDKHNVKATFFINVYEASTHGSDALAEVCRAIHERGHDLELHTHPKPMFGVWGMSQADLATQVNIIKHGAGLIKQWTGIQVVAHRAGAYAANLDTIQACRQQGIHLEFSYNMAWPGCGIRKAGLTENAPFVYDGVLCVPVTCYVQASAGFWRSMRFLDIEASTTQEIRKVVSELQQHDVRTAVIMMHSFSFSRFGEPNERVERTLDDLVAGFVADPDVCVLTARQLYETWRADPDVLVGRDYLPTTGWWLTYCRSWQRLAEGWKNIAVAFMPIIIFILLICASGMWWHRNHRRKTKAGA